MRTLTALEERRAHSARKFRRRGGVSASQKREGIRKPTKVTLPKAPWETAQQTNEGNQDDDPKSPA